METTTTTTEQHDFQKHGLGCFPYEFTGYEERVHQIPGGIGGPANVRPGSTCDRCGAALRHCYWFRSADGVRFKVGIDCAQRADNALGTVCRDARRDFERAERDRLTAEDRAAREAQRASQLAQDVAVSRVRNPSHWEAAEGLKGAEGFAGSFGGDMLARLESGGDLTERQAEILANVWREHNWAPAPADCAGTPGKRAEFTATILRVHDYETFRVWKTIYILADDAGHRFALNTAAVITITGDCRDAHGVYQAERCAKAGDRIRFKATPKEHGEYNGTPQTKIQRLKVLETLESAPA